MKIINTYNLLIKITFFLSITFFANSYNLETLYAEDSNELEIWDPLERVNRGTFWFNERVDQNIAEPWARYYDETTSENVQEIVRNFFNNLKYPQHVVSDTLRFEFAELWNHSVRFTLNSTLGLLGLFDVAKEFGYEKVSNPDMGLAFQELGIPAGPYIVLPFLGPSNARDAIGSVFDTFLDPLFWVVQADVMTTTEEFLIPGMIKSWDFLQRRTDLLETVTTGRQSSLDFYLFAQAAYYQYRNGLSKDNNQSSQELNDSDEDWFDDEVEY